MSVNECPLRPFVFLVLGAVFPAFSTRKERMDPSTLENELLLRYNRDMWDVYLVQEIYESLAQ